MNSYFASLAAQNIEAEGQRYFALVMELDGMDGMEQGWLAFPVQPASQVPLPFTYVPVWPCQLGTREPLRPDFDWPFSDCVVSTSDRLIFVPRILNTGRNAHFLSPRDSQRFAQFFRADRDTFILSQIAERKAQMRQEREEDGFSSEYGSMWRDFSARSTRLTIQPGAFFPPLIWISAQLRYDIAADNTGTWKDLEQDRKRIMR
jgi:hypothetical protein